ncbi:MAG: hypothetical protein K2G70_03220 [Turicibacter sp.]|nr:hypothetical protein [Turicibacter sp.]
MPSPIVHLDVLYHFYKELNKPLDAEVVLGVISPDAIHIRANQTWEDKAITHFYRASEEGYSVALLQAKQRLKTTHPSFLFGYLIHIYTDYWWRDDIYAPYFHREKERITRSKLYELYYADLAHFDQQILNEATWLEEVTHLLRECEPLAAPPLLTEQEVMAWKDKVVTIDLAQASNQEASSSFQVLSESELERFRIKIIQQLKHQFFF